ncbi:MAG: BatD family protein [Alistipes sp.]
MDRIFRKIALTTLLMMVIFTAFAAEKVTFTINAPMIVQEGETFRVEFTLNAQPDKNSFIAPDFTGFDVVAGPAEYTGRSTQIINGSMTRSFTFTITYILLPQHTGNFSIGEARILSDGAAYTTRPLTLEVVNGGVAGGNTAGSSQSMSDEPEQKADRQAQGYVGKDDLLLRLYLSRTTVYKGEPVQATIKLYRRVPIVGFDGVSFPSFNGFWAQDVNTDNAQWQRETVNGKVYESLVVREYLLFPQQAGMLTVDPATITAVAQIVVQNQRSMDPFFGGMPDVREVKRKLTTPKSTIHVLELPTGAPDSFTGAVGRFTMQATPPETQVSANSSATYTLRISGTGNLPFVQAPKLTLPSSFEQYTVKATEAIKSSSASTSGYKQFEYPFIARAEGEYEIKSMEFSYFDPSRMQYITLTAQPFLLEVIPDTSGKESQVKVVNGLSKEDVKLLGEDIRFIKLGRASLHSQQNPLFCSRGYFIVLAVIILLFAAAYAALHKQIRDRRNVVLVRGKRASKVAVLRFRAAKQHMINQDQHAFYEEMLRAMWGYMSDKFNIPVANLTKESVREELHKRGIAAEESQLFSAIITQCDEAQYSPMASAQMHDVYDQGVDFLSRIESIIKR